MSLLQAWLVINTQCLVSTFDEQVDGLSGIKSDQKSMSVDLCESTPTRYLLKLLLRFIV
jgi:hypothetical protein